MRAPERSAEPARRRERGRPRLASAAAALVAASLAGAGCGSLSYPERGPEPSDPAQPQSHVATTTDRSAWVSFSADGRNAMRVRDYAAAEESYLAALAETGGFPVHDVRVRTALGNVLRLARIRQARGEWTDADRLIDQVVRQAERGRLAAFESAAPVLTAQAEHHLALGDPQTAITLYETGLTLYGVHDPALVLTRLDMQSRLGRAYLDAGRPDEAAPHLLSVLTATQSRFGPESLHAARVRIDVAAMREAQGDFTAAERDYLLALTIQERENGGSLEHAVDENRLAWLYLEHDRIPEAERHANASVELLTKLGVSGPNMVASLDTLATAETRRGKVEQAGAHFAQALALYDELDDIYRGELVVLLDHYAELARSVGDAARAEDLAARARRDRKALSPNPPTDPTPAQP